jgi:hypothetical protein
VWRGSELSELRWREGSLFTLPRRRPLDLRNWVIRRSYQAKLTEGQALSAAAQQGRLNRYQENSAEAGRQPCGANATQARTQHLDASAEAS